MGEALNEMQESGKSFRLAPYQDKSGTGLAFSLCGIVILHCVFFFAGWYVRGWHLDFLLHFLAGAWLAAFGAYFLFVRGPVRAGNRAYAALLLLGFAGLTGILWEFHEYVFDAVNPDPSRHMQVSVFDTMGDLFFDLLGASIAVTARYARFPWNSHSS